MTAPAVPAREGGGERARRGELLAALATVGAVLLLFAVRFAVRPQDFWRDDFQTHYLPAMRDIARAVTHGELPLLPSGAWGSGPLLGEYQFGAGSPFLVVCKVAVWALGVGPVTVAALLAAIHEAILAAGAFALARRLGIARGGAAMVGVVAALDGFVFVVCATDWFPALAAFAWLPWFWWAAEGLVTPHATRRGWIAAGIFLGLLLCAGSPYAALMAAAVTAWIVARTALRARDTAIRVGPALVGLMVTWALGLALAAPALLPMLEWYAGSSRSLIAPRAWWDWVVPPRAWLGLVLPSFATPWLTFEGVLRRPAVELAGGLVPVAGLLAGLAAGRSFLRRAGAELVLLTALVALAMLPGYGTFRWSFRWLPLVHLVLAIVGARGLEAAAAAGAAGLRRVLVLPGVAVAALVAFAWAIDPGSEVAPPRSGPLAVTTILLLAAWAAAAWVLRSRLAGDGESRRATSHEVLAPLAAVASIALAWAFVPIGGTVPRWSIGREMLDSAPLRADRRYFALYTRADIVVPFRVLRERGRLDGPLGIGESLRLGNVPLLAGLSFVNGYSGFGHRGLRQVLGISTHGRIVDGALERVALRETGPQGVLAYGAVDGLLVPDRMAAIVPMLRANGWQPAAGPPGVVVLERAPPPRIRSLPYLAVASDEREVAPLLAARPPEQAPLVAAVSESSLAAGVHRFATARVEIERDDRNVAAARVEVPPGGAEALVMFARCWYPGMRAYLDGRELPIEQVARILPAVRVPPGARGTLDLVYRPRSFLTGAALALAALALAGLAALRGRRAPVAAAVIA